MKRRKSRASKLLSEAALSSLPAFLGCLRRPISLASHAFRLTSPLPSHCWQSPGLIGVVGRATEPFNAYEAMKLAETKGNAEALQSMQKVSRDAVGLREVFDEVMAHVCQSDNAPRTVVGDRLEAVSPHQLRERPRGPRPPVQAALNALWATTQLAGMRNPLDRRRLFCDLKGRSLQFSIPPMRVIPSSSVRELSGKEYNARVRALKAAPDS